MAFAYVVAAAVGRGRDVDAANTGHGFCNFLMTRAALDEMAKNPREGNSEAFVLPEKTGAQVTASDDDESDDDDDEDGDDVMTTPTKRKKAKKDETPQKELHELAAEALTKHNPGKRASDLASASASEAARTPARGDVSAARKKQ